jgi:hypothetical protein
MKISQFVSLLLLGCLLQSFSSFAQNRTHKTEQKRKIDVIIEVNGNLVKSELSELHLELNNGTTPKIETQYQPGHLTVSAKDYMRIDTAKEVKIFFDNYSKKGGKLYVTKFKVKLVHAMLSQPYLIVSCYDFNDKDYKRLYENETNKEYAVDITYPGSNPLARNK